jgi:drug/metabolite transporter (DMT)-like permease
VLAYTAYGWRLHNAPAPLVAPYAYVNPVVAVLVGTLFANESLSVPTVVGGAVIVVAVMLIVTSRPHAQPAEVEPPLESVREAA